MVTRNYRNGTQSVWNILRIILSGITRTFCTLLVSHIKTAMRISLAINYIIQVYNADYMITFNINYPDV